MRRRLNSLLWRLDPAIPVIGTMAVIAHLGYYAVFGSWRFLAVVVPAVILCSICGVVARRRRLRVGEAALLYMLGFLVSGLVLTQWPPGPGSIQGFGRGLTEGWANLLSSQLPADLSTTMAPVLFATAWVTTALALELDYRVRFFGSALLGALTGLVATSLLSVEARTSALVQGPALIGLTLVLASIRRTQTERTQGLTRTRRAFHGRARWLAPTALVLLIGFAGAALGPQLPFADSADRFDLRRYQENPWNPLEEPSPLVTIKAQLKDGQDGENNPLFTVESEEPLTRWTLAVMSTFDGVVWQVADPTGDAPAQFVPVDSTLPERPRGSEPPEINEVAATITIVDLRGPWVPHLGQTSQVDQQDDHSLRLNLSTWTIAQPGGLRQGDQFKLRGQVHPDAGVTGIGSLGFEENNDAASGLALVPANIEGLVANRLQGIGSGGPRVAEIQDLFVQEGFYDISDRTPPGHSFADMVQFIEDPERIVGYEEQYAATAAVLAKVAGVETRVAVGFRIPMDRYEDGVADIRPADSSAWIEVYVDGRGWIPVDVTPDRSREPTNEELGTVVRSIAIPNEPPPPPPPLDSDPVDELEDEDEDEEDDEDEELLTEQRSLLERMRDQPLLVAIGVGGIPIVGLVLLGIATAFLKSARRRRRRRRGSPRRRTVAAWAEFVDRFEEAGYEIPANATPGELAERIVAADAVRDEDQVRELAAVATSGAFARQEPDEATIDAAWSRSKLVAADAAGLLGTADRLKMRCDPRPLLRRHDKEKT